jgi:hypothetical protein
LDRKDRKGIAKSAKPSLSTICDTVGEEIGIYFIISLVALVASFLDRKDRKGIAKIAKPSLSAICDPVGVAKWFSLRPLR